MRNNRNTSEYLREYPTKNKNKKTSKTKTEKNISEITLKMK
jgi:propanediol dehydratase small subunit